MDHTPEQKDRVKELLLVIAGYEETLRMSIAEDDRAFQKVLIEQKTKAYQRLKRVMYGLPEEKPESLAAAEKG